MTSYVKHAKKSPIHSIMNKAIIKKEILMVCLTCLYGHMAFPQALVVIVMLKKLLTGLSTWIAIVNGKYAVHIRLKDSKGYRVFDPSDWGAEEGLITSPEEISLDSWYHSETILVNHKIVGIWIKKWALKDPNLKKLWDYLVPIAKDNGWLTHVCKARRE